MRSLYTTTSLVALLALPAAAQQRTSAEIALGAGAPETDGTVMVAAGAQYAAGPVHRFFLGDGHRELWTTPVPIPVLDLDSYGGLEPESRGGNSQSITLHMKAGNGREYLFRSVDKHLNQGFPAELKNSPLSRVFQDAISAMYPGASVAVSRMLDATDLLHARPWLVVMPDDPRLGEFRETFAGMLGTIEESPNEGPDETPGFAGSTRVTGSEAFLERLEEGDGVIDGRAYLKARLIDFIINDTDRGTDQWRWARIDLPDRSVWEPIPRDRDFAFINGDRFFGSVARLVYPKLVELDPTFPKLLRLTVQAWELDRPLLAGLDWPAWESVVSELQAELSDAVLADAIAELPEAWAQQSRDELTTVLRARRANLRGEARKFYEMLAQFADIQGTDKKDVATIERQPDGNVRVRLAWAKTPDRPYLDRTFLHGETDEIRIDLHGDDDRAEVTGRSGYGAMIVRVEGGGGDDELADRATGNAWWPRTMFYDARGDNAFVTANETWVNESHYDAPPPDDSYMAQRVGLTEERDWGDANSIRPYFGYGEGAGVIVGATFSHETYGFRTDPYRYYLSGTGMYATRSGGFGGQGRLDVRLPSSQFGLEATARATSFDSYRFYGYGNEEGHLKPGRSLVMEDRYEATVAGVWRDGTAALGAGPVFRYTDPRYPSASPIGRTSPLGSEAFGRAGARAFASIGEMPEEVGVGGLRASVVGEAFPALWDADADYETLQGEVAGYLPLPFWKRPTLAARVGGRRAWGAFPVEEAALLGGATTVRGYRFNRFAGQTAAWGSAELRAPLFRLTLLTHGRLGVIGLADVGRVWLSPDDSNEWHTGYGGGVFYETLGPDISVVYADGEEGRTYVYLGLPF